LSSSRDSSSPTAVARPTRHEPPAATARASGGRHASARPARPVLADEHLPPWERGPVRAFVRDAVDAGRRWRPVLLFMPAFALALIAGFGPDSELGDNLLLGSLVVLVVVVADALVLGWSMIRMARQAFPNERVGVPGTLWYVFMRAHRPRSMRRPPPRV
jgi:hypothetical protein